MTLLTRYNTRLFEPFFRFPYLEETTMPCNAPVDVAEENEKILVKVEVPGVDEKDLRVTFEAGLLTITGERAFERKDERNYHRLERSYGSFTRSFSLPRSVEANKIVANYRNGILEIEIPKKEEARAKQIAINVNAKQIEA